MQFGVGRVSTTHAPWSQYLPAPHSPSLAHDVTQARATHFGAAGSAHCASAVQPVGPVGVGLHTPFSHVKPSLHGAASQLARHWPSAQTLPSAHSLEYVHVFSGAVHAPAMHVNSPAQSADTSQGHGPESPPHAAHTPPLQVALTSQSALVVHSFAEPGSAPGGAQKPPWQVSPFGQSASPFGGEQVVVHPMAVQTWPGAQLFVPEHVGCAGEGTGEQP